MSRKFVKNLKVISNTPLNSTNFLIKLQAEDELPEIKPGQFINIKIENTDEIFLRRPFSVFDIDYEQNTISILAKILGRGSKKLTEIEESNSISIVFPLGNGFTKPDTNDKILLLGGGSGLAPVLFLAKWSGLPKEKIDVIIGAKTSEDHIDLTKYQHLANIFLTTEDGSSGERGFVTNHSIVKNQLEKYTKIYACGPDGMMKAVAKIAKKTSTFCEVSLENLMACGFGVCLCCIEPTVKGNVCVCTDGPVFNINDLKWQL